MSSSIPSPSIPSNKIYKGGRNPSLWKKVADRDFGKCALCNLECDQLQDILRKLLLISGQRTSDQQDTLTRHNWAIDWNRIAGGTVKKRLWEADHIIPLCLTGEDCLENMRTLCIPCHRAETKKLIQILGKMGAYAKRTA